MTNETESSRDVQEQGKALAVAQLDAMKGELSYTVKDKHLGWLLRVRTRDGSLFQRHCKSLASVVRDVHEDWAPHHAREREELVARAAKFNVADVASQKPEFTGIREVPEKYVSVYAHFYDTLISLQDKNPELLFNRSEPPVRWVLKMKEHEDIAAPTLRRMCSRLDAFMHKHFLDQRQEILTAAKEAGLVAPEEGSSDEGEEDLPVVLMPDPKPRPDARLQRAIPLYVAVVAFVAGLLSGILIGSMVR